MRDGEREGQGDVEGKQMPGCRKEAGGKGQSKVREKR